METGDVKDRIAEALDATRFKQRGFSVGYDSADGVLATITRFGYRFIINSGNDGFTTVENPGVNSDPETFQRSNLELCIDAIRNWVERIIDREESDILDQFGGVADRNPSLPTK